MIENKGKFTIQLKKLAGESSAYITGEQNRDKIAAIIYIILSLLSLSFFGIFAISPTLATVSGLKKDFEANKILLQQLKGKAESLSTLRNQYQLIQSDLPLLVNAITSSAEVPKLTRQIEIIDSRNSLSVEKLDTDLLELYPSKNVSNPIFSYSFSVTVNGEQNSIDNFIKEIVNIDRVIGIDRLSVGAEENIFSAVINGKAFFYKP